MATIPAGTAADVDARRRRRQGRVRHLVDDAGRGARQVPVPHRRRARRPHGRAGHDDLQGDRHGQVAVAARPGRPADQQLQVGGRDRRGATASRRRSATRSIVREPIGVVGCITPWNYPLHQIAAKVAYAMAAGCTVVLKPSARSPRSTRSCSPRSSTRSGSRPACSTSSPASARWSVRRSPPTPTSTWCRSPARPAPASASPSSAPRTSSGSPSSSAASRPTCCSTTSTSRGLRQGRRRRRAEGVPQLRPDVLGADPHARARRPPRRGRADRRGRRRQGQRRRPVRRGRPPRPARLGRPARPRPGLHPEGHRRGRHASSPAALGAPGGPRHRLLRPPDRVLQRHART